MSWINGLKEKWELKSLFQVVMVLLVFSCTGATVLFIRAPLIGFIGQGGETQWWENVIYFLLVLPIYNVVLLCYGFIFGQFKFFWKYEQKMLGRFGIRKNVGKR